MFVVLAIIIGFVNIVHTKVIAEILEEGNIAKVKSDGERNEQQASVF